MQRRPVVLIGALCAFISSVALASIQPAGPAAAEATTATPSSTTTEATTLAATTVPSSAGKGTRFRAGEAGLSSPNAEYQLAVEASGILAITADNNVIWSAGTAGAGNWAAVQGDGNFVLYSAAGKALWNTGTSGHPGTVTLTIANSGAVTLTTNDTETWATDQAPAGGRLRAGGQVLLAPDGQYRLAMQATGNLELTGDGKVLWSTNTSGAGNWAAVQGDGNFVVYSAAGKALWNSRTSGHAGTVTLTLTNDGAVVLATNAKTTWTASDPVAALPTGSRLLISQFLRSANGQFELSLQAGGNLVLTDDGLTAWQSHTSGTDNWAIVQGDGNFVVYSPAGKALWNAGTNTSKAGSSTLSLTDSALVLARSGKTTWSPAIKATSLSTAGATFIGTWEGFVATPYNDPSDNCTIGYGHLISTSPCTAADDAKWGTITQAEGLTLLKSDASSFANDITAGFPSLTLIQPQMDALISFTYNVGPGWISSSGLKTDLSVTSPDFANVPAQLDRWVYAGGVPLCGLYQRRVSEGHLFTTASYAIERPACPSGYSGATSNVVPPSSSAASEAQQPYNVRHTPIGVAPGQQP